MRWNCMSKALRFLQITAEHQDCPFFTVFLTTKSLSQNISITLLQISLKLHEHRGGYWRKKLPWTILEEQFPVSRYTALGSPTRYEFYSGAKKKWAALEQENKNMYHISSIKSENLLDVSRCSHANQRQGNVQESVLQSDLLLFLTVLVRASNDCFL